LKPERVSTLQEFVGWLTDREADRTVGNDGWIEKFDIHALMRPMFNVFDRNKDGLIRRSELKECSQILGNSLSIHPASTSDCLVLDWKELPNKEEVNFQDFVDWQVKHLQKSGIPNNQLPTLMEELCESMQIIFDIDQLNQKGVENSKVHEALADSVRKVADATRRIYTKKLSQLDLMSHDEFDEHCMNALLDLICFCLRLRKRVLSCTVSTRACT